MNICFILRGEGKPPLSPHREAHPRRSSPLSVRGSVHQSEEGLSRGTRRLGAALFGSSSFRMFINHVICGHGLHQIKKKSSENFVTQRLY